MLAVNIFLVRDSPLPKCWEEMNEKYIAHTIWHFRTWFTTSRLNFFSAGLLFILSWHLLNILFRRIKILKIHIWFLFGVLRFFMHHGHNGGLKRRFHFSHVAACWARLLCFVLFISSIWNTSTGIQSTKRSPAIWKIAINMSNETDLNVESFCFAERLFAGWLGCYLNQVFVFSFGQ